jgi:hypothetical protein
MLALGQQFLHFLHICMLLGSRVTLPIESDCLRIRFFTIADVIFHVACLLGLTLIFMLVLFFKRVNFWFNLGVFYWWFLARGWFWDDGVLKIILENGHSQVLVCINLKKICELF